MKLLALRTLLLTAALMVAGCDNAPQALVLEGKTMGTSWRVSLADVDTARASELREKIQARLDADDRLLSTWKDDSALMRFNHARTTAPWPVDEAMADIVTESLRVGAKTDNAMDITVGPLVNLWGFGPDKQPVKTPDQAQIDAARARTGLSHLKVINGAGQQWLQ
ncbi:FAD:protein FMN transferase, partial [Cronobacter sakazakii]